jgi:hypothetical protein
MSSVMSETKRQLREFDRPVVNPMRWAEFRLTVRVLVPLLALAASLTYLSIPAGASTAFSQTQSAQPVAPSPNPRTDLEMEKLRLEIQNLRSPWSPWLPVLPSFFAAVAVIIAFITAWKTGVFEARNLKLQADNAKLEYQKDRYKVELAEFEKTKQGLVIETQQLRTTNETLTRQLSELNQRIAGATRQLQLADVSTFINKLKTEGTPSSAVDDLVTLLRIDDAMHTERLALLDESIAPPAELKNVALLEFARYLAFSNTEARGRLFEALSGIALSFVEGQRPGALAILGDSRWPDSDRTEVGRLIVGLLRQDGFAGRSVALLKELGRLHDTTPWNPRTYRRQIGVAKTRFRLDRVARSEFFRAVVVARDIVLDKTLSDALRSEALAAMAQFAPIALLPTVSQLLVITDFSQPSTMGRGVQSAVDFVNGIMVPELSGPASPTPHENSLDEYAASRLGSWRKWNEQHASFRQIWLEPHLDTLNQEPGRYDTFFEDPYG